MGGVSVVVMIFSLSVKYIKYTQIWTLDFGGQVNL